MSKSKNQPASEFFNGEVTTPNNETALAPQQPNALTTATAPPRGFESGEDNSDIMMPRGFLLQKGSPLVEEGTHTAGQVINSMTHEMVGDTFIPLFYWKEYAKFNPKDRDKVNFDPKFEPGEKIWGTRDPSDERVIAECSFGPNNEKPTATTYFNFLCLFEGTDYPLVLSFAKTSYGAGKKLYSLAKMLGGDLFSRKYELQPAQKTNAHGTFFVFDLTPSGIAEGEQLLKAEKLWTSMHGVMDRVQADVSDAE